MSKKSDFCTEMKKGKEKKLLALRGRRIYKEPYKVVSFFNQHRWQPLYIGEWKCRIVVRLWNWNAEMRLEEKQSEARLGGFFLETQQMKINRKLLTFVWNQKLLHNVGIAWCANSSAAWQNELCVEPTHT